MDQNAALSLGQGNSSFQQQGQWNMFEILKLPVQASLGILARYNAARVNPYTALVGEIICQNFQISQKGRQNVELAVQNLKVVGSWGNALEFGFGVEDVVRNMARSERGCTCLALCASLMECYSEEVATEVLLELARLVNVEKQHMPSNQSWKDLLRACAGTVSSSKLPFLVEHFYASITSTERSMLLQRHSVPSSLAAALTGISKVSRGELRAITIYGTFDAAWMAALAEWLFDLKVTIRREDGNLYYSSFEDENAEAQVLVYMRTKPRTWAPDSLRTESTFVLEDVSILFNNQQTVPGQFLRNEVASGRLPWKNLFGSTFPLEFRHLMQKVPLAFGKYLGSVARLLKGLCQADAIFPLYCRISCTNYSDASYGTGLVLSMVKLFPELSPLEHNMLKEANQDVKSALERCESSRANLCISCNCELCMPQVTSMTDYGQTRADFDWKPLKIPAPRGSPTGSIHGEADDDTPDLDFGSTDKFCPGVVAETIVTLAWTLTNVFLEDEDLLPTRSGIQMAYEKQFYKHVDETNHDVMEDMKKELGEFAYLLDVTTCNAARSSNEAIDNERLTLRFDILEIFTGKPTAPVLSTSPHSAVSTSGICAFLGVLRQDGMEDADLATKVHVLPGRISYEKKFYQFLRDYKNLRDRASPWGLQEAEKLVKFAGLPLQSSMLIKESYSSLQAWIEIKFASTDENELDQRLEALRLTGPGDSDAIAPPTLNIAAGPTKLAAVLAFRRGLIQCKKSRYLSTPMIRGQNEMGCPWTLAVSTQQVQEAMNKIEEIRIGMATCRVLPFTEKGVGIAAVASALHESSSFVIVRKECLNCSLKAVLVSGQDELCIKGNYLLVLPL
jgi:hypothetical protein